MHILITGASGRIGRHVTERLLASDHTVQALVEPSDPRRSSLERPGVTVVVGQLADQASLHAAVEGADAVIHLAAALTTHGHPDDAFFEANVMGTYRLLAAIRDRGEPLHRFVYISSDAVYWSGGSEGADYLPVDESHPRRPGSVYGASKLAAEELCHTFGRLHGFPIAVVRPTATADAAELIDPDSVFGRRMFVSTAIAAMESSRAAIDVDLLAALRDADDGTLRLFVVADAAGRTHRVTLNDARDTAAGIVAAMELDAAVGEAFNVGPVDSHDDAALIAYLGERLGLPHVAVRTPNARSDWEISSAKAAELLGYRSTHTVYQMVDEALAARGGAG